jgi:DNA primase
MPRAENILNFVLKEIELPEKSLSIVDWLNTGLDDPDLVAVVEYLLSRGMAWDWYNWYWSASPGFRDRLLIPFYQDGKIVGYTGRKVTDGKPKYLTESQSGYVFNVDRQNRDRQYVIVVEGQFDAIAIDGVAIMTNEPNDTQVARLQALGKEVICVPDRDRPGAKMLKHAVKNNWSASLPPWGDDVKDVADAVKKYGRLYVLTTILHYKVAGEIKINLLKKKLESLDE